MTPLKKIYVERDAASFPLTKSILDRCRGVPVEFVRDGREIDEGLAASADPVAEGKKILWLARQKGAFVKPCPCTPHYLGCNYFIINAALNCPLDCSYCILQLYLASPVTTVYVNLEDMWKELDIFRRRRKGKFSRIGTGELSDSLALDPFTRTSGDLMSYFEAKGDALFELKTKTTHIAGILQRPPSENIVVAWSLNSAKIAREEECGAPDVGERVEAAGVVSKKGFPVAFHFDPLILYPGWEEGYAGIIEKLFRTVRPSRVRWISLGSLRFPPALKPVIEKRFPRSRIIYAEMIPGRDGKLRYFKPLRLDLYQRIVRLIGFFGGGGIPLYLCMEDAEVWRQVLNKKPGRKEEIELSLSPRSNASNRKEGPK
jgi:spore photoproduct lyase